MLNEPSTRAHRFEARRISVRLAFLGAVVLAVVGAAIAGAQPLSVIASLSSGSGDGITATDGGGPQASAEPPADWQDHHHWDDPWPPSPHPSGEESDSPSPYPGPPTPIAPPPNGAEAPAAGLGAPPAGPPIPGASSPASASTTPGGGVAGPIRDPVAGGPGKPTTGLGDPVDPTTSGPRPATPAVTPVVAPVRAAEEEDVGSSTAYRRSLVLSGLAGLVLAATGLTMVGIRRRRW
ncbi:hypothetical protein [Micromonospora sp. CPCC 206061]|uniref:hypothetical protein n=1 Tax=Micromonospora sp. CPCC 206061 TaxID=3122410 RepID=UPI002FF3E9B5